MLLLDILLTLLGVLILVAIIIAIVWFVFWSFLPESADSLRLRLDLHIKKIIEGGH